MTLRRTLLIACVMGALILVLSSCAANPVGWKDEPDFDPLPVRFVPSSLEAIRRCTGTSNSIGCASRDYVHNACWVLVPADAPKWLLEHEMAHCAGLSHF